jgi:nucleoside-diphosphate-sugar epimerase
VTTVVSGATTITALGTDSISAVDRDGHFMEMRLAPALGWDFAAGTAQVLGSGEQRVSCISARDVVTAIVACIDNQQAQGQRSNVRGPEAVTPLEGIELVQSLTRRALAVERVPVEELERQAQAGRRDRCRNLPVADAVPDPRRRNRSRTGMAAPANDRRGLPPHRSQPSTRRTPTAEPT